MADYRVNEKVKQVSDMMNSQLYHEQIKLILDLSLEDRKILFLELEKRYNDRLEESNKYAWEI